MKQETENGFFFKASNYNLKLVSTFQKNKNNNYLFHFSISVKLKQN